MRLERLKTAIRTWVIVRLDQFLSWPPLAQLPAILGLTALLLLFWAWLHASLVGPRGAENFWFAVTRFMDGGAMSQDRGLERILAIAVTSSGILVVSFLTGAFASKLGERIDDLRSGRSPVSAREHLLILGFDAKVPLVVRELARSHQRLTVVVLAQEDKPRLDGLLRFASRIAGSRLRTIARTGDPRSELALQRVGADRARAILLIAPARLSDDSALRWCVSTLLAVRRAVGSPYHGRVIVEARRSVHGALLSLTGEAGLAGVDPLPLDIFATDDIVARVLAQSIRQAGVYFALRELLSFRGNELYLEPVPSALVGKTFEEAHSLVVDGIVVGIFRDDGGHVFATERRRELRLGAGDRLIVLEEDRGAFTLGIGLSPGPAPAPPQPLERSEARRVLVVGANRTLPRLVCELDRILSEGSTIILATPPLPPEEGELLGRAVSATARVAVERTERRISELHVRGDPVLHDADGVVILGCEDELDPDGDASALAILLNLRHARRHRALAIRRLVTEVRDPATAQQIAGSPDDFLVSTDVVAMVLAQACIEPELAPAYRELLDPTGVEVYCVPRSVYLPDGPATFAEVMAAARRRDELAIGFYPFLRGPSAPPSAESRELGHAEIDELAPVLLNPPRDTVIPSGPEAAIVVFAMPPRG